MAKKIRIIVPIAFVAGLAALLIWLTKGHTVMLLEPKGTIATQQRDLLVFATVLSLFVILPVYILTIAIAWKYRATNKKATYRPDWESNKKLELTWWGIPFAIILILSVVTWQTSHSLDPYRPLSSSYTPLKVQVVALQWNWLFIYPDQKIATINYVRIPEAVPIEFEITSDAPMNSFWIPQLGGQMYAMPGMKTKLHLMANETGRYAGSSANISGEGFSEMRFDTEVSSNSDFERWVSETKQGMVFLDKGTYERIAEPSLNMARTSYASVAPDLYDTIVMKYMMPGPSDTAPRQEGKKQEETHAHH